MTSSMEKGFETSHGEANRPVHQYSDNGASAKRPIPFTQYLLPDGRKREEFIERPADVADIADRFIAAGGRYECEILTTGHVSLTAVKEVDGEYRDVEIIISTNGPDIPSKVDELVRRSLTHLEQRQSTDEQRGTEGRE